MLFDCWWRGLLFLPAAVVMGRGMVRYWSVAAAYGASGGAYKIDLYDNFTWLQNSQGRYDSNAIRLASRSELFGCSVDGVGVSVPARCGYGVLDYFRIYPDACVCCCTLRE